MTDEWLMDRTISGNQPIQPRAQTKLLKNPMIGIQDLSQCPQREVDGLPGAVVIEDLDPRMARRGECGQPAVTSPAGQPSSHEPALKLSADAHAVKDPVLSHPLRITLDHLRHARESVTGVDDLANHGTDLRRLDSSGQAIGTDRAGERHFGARGDDRAFVGWFEGHLTGLSRRP